MTNLINLPQPSAARRLRRRFPELRLGFEPWLQQEFEALQVRSACPTGAILFRQDSPAMGLFVVRRGLVKLSVGRPGKPDLVVRIAGEGEALGVIATMSDQPYIGTATALSPCEIAYVPRVPFVEFLNRHPEARMKVLEFLTREVSGAYQHVRALAAAKVARR